MQPHVELIEAAIRGRKLIRIFYEPGERVIECHALGWSADGNLLLRAYQTDGASASNEHENWKLFRVDRMRVCETFNTEFDGPRPGYKRGDKAMKRGIIAEL